MAIYGTCPCCKESSSSRWMLLQYTSSSGNGSAMRRSNASPSVFDSMMLCPFNCSRTLPISPYDFTTSRLMPSVQQNAARGDNWC
jgi:hypothetical protein